MRILNIVSYCGSVSTVVNSRLCELRIDYLIEDG